MGLRVKAQVSPPSPSGSPVQPPPVLGHLLWAGSFLDEKGWLKDSNELMPPNLSLSFLVPFSKFLPMGIGYFSLL